MVDPSVLGDLGADALLDDLDDLLGDNVAAGLLDALLLPDDRHDLLDDNVMCSLLNDAASTASTAADDDTQSSAPTSLDSVATPQRRWGGYRHGVVGTKRAKVREGISTVCLSVCLSVFGACHQCHRACSLLLLGLRVFVRVTAANLKCDGWQCLPSRIIPGQSILFSVFLPVQLIPISRQTLLS